jgi:hypothetical protein
MAEGWRTYLSAWEDLRSDVDEYRELDEERVLVMTRLIGRGRTSGLELGEMRAKGATLLHINGGKVTKLVAYATPTAPSPTSVSRRKARLPTRRTDRRSARDPQLRKADTYVSQRPGLAGTRNVLGRRNGCEHPGIDSRGKGGKSPSLRSPWVTVHRMRAGFRGPQPVEPVLPEGLSGPIPHAARSPTPPVPRL